MPSAGEPKVVELKVIRASQFVYACFLACYPRELRRRFGAEMAEVFEESLREAAVKRGMRGITTRWSCALWELFTVAVPSLLGCNALMAGALSLLASAILFLTFFSVLKKAL